MKTPIQMCASALTLCAVDAAVTEILDRLLPIDDPLYVESQSFRITVPKKHVGWCMREFPWMEVVASTHQDGFWVEHVESGTSSYTRMV